MKHNETAASVFEKPHDDLHGKFSFFSAAVVAAIFSSVIVILFYCFVERFSEDHSKSALGWLLSAWNPENDYEHGKLVGVIMLIMLFSRHKDIRAAAGKGSSLGLLVVFLGCLFYVAGFRALQPRISVGGLPLILWGGVLYLWGWQVARLTLFPLFFLWIAIPLPTFQQATTHLQLLATSIAHHGSNMLGIQTYTQGTTILPVKGNWEPLSIAHGCSGIRSLMALLMISAAWAYLARISFWKRCVLFLSAIPLAILGNSLRIVSIFVIAEHGDAKWAATTWHDWSGLLLFYPFSLLMLLALHSVLEGGLPWNTSKRRKLRRITVRSANSSPPPATT